MKSLRTIALGAVVSVFILATQASAQRLAPSALSANPNVSFDARTSSISDAGQHRYTKQRIAGIATGAIIGAALGVIAVNVYHQTGGTCGGGCGVAHRPEAAYVGAVLGAAIFGGGVWWMTDRR